MDRVGLCPTDTGEPVGKRTGDGVAHYIEEGERFDMATQKLLATGFELSWIDCASEGHSSPTTPKKTREKYSSPVLRFERLGEAWRVSDVYRLRSGNEIRLVIRTSCGSYFVFLLSKRSVFQLSTDKILLAIAP